MPAELYHIRTFSVGIIDEYHQFGSAANTWMQEHPGWRPTFAKMDQGAGPRGHTMTYITVIFERISLAQPEPAQAEESTA